MSFKKASKKQARLRMALIGPAGSGKTFSALSVAKGLGSKIALIDTEHASASKYADKFNFDTEELDSFHPQQYINVIKEAEAAGYDVLVIDSLSHAWMGKDGALELVDQAAKRSKSHNSFTAWRDVTPLHNALVEAMLASKCHIIATMRSKAEYVIEEVNGKKMPRKVGLAPIQREGMDFEFDLAGDMDDSHTLVVTKSRCSELSNAIIKEPGEELGKQLKVWLSDGAAPDPGLRLDEVRADIMSLELKILNNPTAKNKPQALAKLEELKDEEATLVGALNVARQSPDYKWKFTCQQHDYRGDVECRDVDHDH